MIEAKDVTISFEDGYYGGYITHYQDISSNGWDSPQRCLAAINRILAIEISMVVSEICAYRNISKDAVRKIIEDYVKSWPKVEPISETEQDVIWAFRRLFV